MTKVYKKHIFICENERDSSKTKSCGIVGAEIRAKLKTEIVKKGLKKDIRVNRSGCLGKCLEGPCAVIYPESDWHFNLNREDYKKLLNKLVLE